MQPVQATFEVAKVENNIWDVLIFAEDSVLKAFVKVYPELTYVEESIFAKKPMVIAADFPNQIHANSPKPRIAHPFRHAPLRRVPHPVHRAPEYLKIARQRLRRQTYPRELIN